MMEEIYGGNDEGGDEIANLVAKGKESSSKMISLEMYMRLVKAKHS